MLKTLFICIVGICYSAEPPRESHCPKVHYWRDLGGEYCYYIENERTLNFLQASVDCNRRGGNLVSLHSKEESDMLLPFIKKRSIFIGLLRHPDRKAEFIWTDGSEMDYENWDYNEPNDEKEKCAETFIRDTTGGKTFRWNDILCEARLSYICSVKKIPSCPTIAEVENYRNFSNSTLVKEEDEYTHLSNSTLVNEEDEYTYLSNSTLVKEEDEYTYLPNSTLVKEEDEYTHLPNSTLVKEEDEYTHLSNSTLVKEEDEYACHVYLKTLIGITISIFLMQIFLTVMIYYFRPYGAGHRYNSTSTSMAFHSTSTNCTRDNFISELPLKDYEMMN